MKMQGYSLFEVFLHSIGLDKSLALTWLSISPDTKEVAASILSTQSAQYFYEGFSS